MQTQTWDNDEGLKACVPAMPTEQLIEQLEWLQTSVDSYYSDITEAIFSEVIRRLRRREHGLLSCGCGEPDCSDCNDEARARRQGTFARPERFSEVAFGTEATSEGTEGRFPSCRRKGCNLAASVSLRSDPSHGPWCHQHVPARPPEEYVYLPGPREDGFQT